MSEDPPERLWNVNPQKKKHKNHNNNNNNNNKKKKKKAKKSQSQLSEKKKTLLVCQGVSEIKEKRSLLARSGILRSFESPGEYCWATVIRQDNREKKSWVKFRGTMWCQKKTSCTLMAGYPAMIRPQTCTKWRIYIWDQRKEKTRKYTLKKWCRIFQSSKAMLRYG